MRKGGRDSRSVCDSLVFSGCLIVKWCGSHGNVKGNETRREHVWLHVARQQAILAIEDLCGAKQIIDFVWRTIGSSSVQCSSWLVP